MRTDAETASRGDAHTDVVVLGGGSAGEALATLLATAGQQVVLLEPGLVGGACPYVACMPSKALLRVAAAVAESENGVAGNATRPRDAWVAALAHRERVTHGRSDREAAQALVDAGVILRRARGELTAPGEVAVVEADGRRSLLRAQDVAVCTGSEPAPPPVPGLADAGYWTSEDALSASELPDRLLIVGAGPVGCELAQAYCRLGARVVLVDSAPTVLGREDPVVAGRLAAALADDGVDLWLDARLESVTVGPRGTAVAATAAGVNRQVVVDRVLVAAGRRPRTGGLGLEALGVTAGGSVPVNDRCQVLGDHGPIPHLWALGDVTGTAPYTHTATYQARVVAAAIIGGEPQVARYESLPRAVYTDPTVASVGSSLAAARERSGADVRVGSVEFTDVARQQADGVTSKGVLRIFLDVAADRIRGAAAFGPHAEEWLSVLGLALRADVPASVVADTVFAFPAYAEAITAALADAGCSRDKHLHPMPH